MNVHHLELFYYVAKYEGITAAVRKMPYGIQQPALSGQILQLEEKLGVKLFHRRPFALTHSGEELYDFIYPFFSQLAETQKRLRGEERQHLRLAATASALRSHLPDVLESLKHQEPQLRLTLREVAPADVHSLLSSQKVDVAIGVIGGQMTEGLRAEVLLEIPCVLWVPVDSPAKTWRCLIQKDSHSKKGWIGSSPLIGLPPNEFLQQKLNQEFERQHLSWPVSVEVDSMDLICDYVLRGFGVGIGVQIPGLEVAQGVKALPLDGFSPLVIGAIFQGEPKALVRDFIKLAKQHVKSLA